MRLPFGRKAIGCTWVYKTKRGKSGEVVKRKARLCFRGDRQKFGVDYQAVFAPTLRTLLALAAYYDLEVEKFDVVTAFLNVELTDSEVYMAQPDGYVKYDDNGIPYVCKLNKAICGIKQAPREWNQLLTAWLVSYGWTRNLADPDCFTITVDCHLYVLAVYVDNIGLHSARQAGSLIGHFTSFDFPLSSLYGRQRIMLILDHCQRLSRNVSHKKLPQL